MFHCEAAMTALVLLALAAPPVPETDPKPEIRFGMRADTSEYLPLLLLQKAPVKTELRLTEEQGTKVKELRAKLVAKLKDARNRTVEELKTYYDEIAKEVDESLPPLLTEGQYKRLRQLVWQTVEATQGPMGVAKNVVAVKSLGLTADQLKQVEEWGKEFDLARRSGRTDPKAPETVKALNAKLLASLTAEQKRRWNDLQGEPFKEERLILQPGQRPLKFPEPKK